jgi:hypothetical protein
LCVCLRVRLRLCFVGVLQSSSTCPRCHLQLMNTYFNGPTTRNNSASSFPSRSVESDCLRWHAATGWNHGPGPDSSARCRTAPTLAVALQSHQVSVVMPSSHYTDYFGNDCNSAVTFSAHVPWLLNSAPSSQRPSSSQVCARKAVRNSGHSTANT